MKEELLREIAQEYLVPFFSGAKINPNFIDSSARENKVSFSDPCSVAFKAEKDDGYRLILNRAQAFTNSARDKIPEKVVIESFVEELGKISHLVDGPLKRDLLTTFQRKVVARSLMNGRYTDAILTAIDQLSHWATRLYEGAPISAGIGLRNIKANEDVISIQDISKEDFAAVFSNGHDTIMEFAYSGDFVRHQTLISPAAPPPYCPIRQAGIAEWTVAHEQRVALTLNRLGEILIFRDQMLVFARRSGHWHFLTHDPVIKQMNVPRDVSIRKAIYETCLDASFARTGACLGVVQVDADGSWRKLLDPDDFLETGLSMKTKAINRVVRGELFQKIDRRTRQELSAIDGATIISHTGVILAVGAILKLPSGGSAGGGGRLAAARALSKAGLGIKVSQDGGISGYRLGSAQPVFRVM